MIIVSTKLLSSTIVSNIDKKKMIEVQMSIMEQNSHLEFLNDFWRTTQKKNTSGAVWIIFNEYHVSDGKAWCFA